MPLTGKIASFILIIILGLSLCSFVISPYEPEKIDLDSIKEPPSPSHPFGTDNKGRDILSRILYGGRISIGVAITATLLSMSIGLVAGLCSGYFGGKVDTAIMAFVDLVLSFPALLLAIGISIILPPEEA